MDDRSDNRIEAGGEPLGPHLTSKQQTAHLDGDLTAPERARIATHLETCPQCVHELAQLRLTVALLSALPQPRPNRSFHLDETHARVTHSWWERFGLWLLPTLPALRTATVATALLLITVSVGDVIWNRSGNAPVVRDTIVEETSPPQTATVAIVATMSLDRSEAKATATVTPEPTTLGASNQLPPTQAPTAPAEQATEESDDESGDSADTAAPADAAARSEPTSDATAESDAAAGAGANAATGAGAAAQPAPTEGNATGAAGITGRGGESSEEPQSDTDANSSEGDGGAEDITMMAVSESESSPASDDGANVTESFAPTAEVTLTQSSSPTTPATITPTTSPQPEPSPPNIATVVPSITPTPAAPTNDTSSAASDDGLSWWRIAQIVLGIVLVFTATTAVFLGRLRRRT